MSQEDDVKILDESVVIEHGSRELPIVVNESDMNHEPSKEDDHSLLSRFKQFLTEMGVIDHGMDIEINESSELPSDRSPYTVDEITWPEADILPDELVIVDDLSNRDRKKSITVTHDNLINFVVWDVEQNPEAAGLFFVNLRRNLPRMVKESFVGEANLKFNDDYYRSGEYVDVQDYMLATKKWGVPIAIHSPGRHAALVLKMPEYDKQREQWSVLVYDPIAGGESIRWLEKAGSEESIRLDDPEIEIVETLTDVNEDDPRSDPMRYGLLINLENEQTMELWKSGKYDLSVASDDRMAHILPEEIVESKSQRVQFDLNNCVLASGFMAVVRAFLKYPELFDIKKRANLYKDTGATFRLRSEVLRQSIPPSIEELIANMDE